MTLFSSVPSLVKDLLTQPNLDEFDITSLQRVSSGGAAMPSDLPGIIDAQIDQAYASGGYGLTETLAVGSQAAGAVFDAKPTFGGGAVAHYARPMHCHRRYGSFRRRAG